MLNKEKSAYSGKTTIFALLIICVSLSAQQNDSSRNSLTKGKLALMFAVNKDFEVSGLDGGTITLKYNLSRKFGVRAGASIYYQNDDGNNFDYYSGYIGNELFKDENYQVNMYLVYYPNPNDIVNFYLGLGPLYSWSYTERYWKLQAETIHDYNHLWYLGAGLLIGAEVFPTRSISLLAEYLPYFYFGKLYEYRYRSDLGYTEYKKRDKNKNIKGVNGTTVRLGVSLYFNWPF